MKVAVIAPTTIPSKKANTLQVMKMTQAISSIGHQAHLVIPDSIKPQTQVDRNWEVLAHHYGLHTEFPMTWLSGKKELRKYDFAWHAVSWTKNWGADVVFTRLPQAAAIAAYRDSATIFEMHDLPQGTFGPLLFQLFLRGRGAQKLVTISRALADDLEGYFPDLLKNQPPQVLPDGVDLQRYEDLPSPEMSRELLASQLIEKNLHKGSIFSPAKFTVGYTGHLYPGRGMSLVLDMAESMTDINFLIVGGEENDVRNLLDQVEKRKIKNVTITGFVSNSDLPRYQSACDILLLPYQKRVAASSGGDIARYLSPMKLFEYLACRRVICSSDLQVLKEILTPEIALLLPPDDAGAWVAAIEKLIENPALRMEFGDRAKQASARYSWEARAERIFDSVIPAR